MSKSRLMRTPVSFIEKIDKMKKKYTEEKNLPFEIDRTNFLEEIEKNIDSLDLFGKKKKK